MDFVVSRRIKPAGKLLRNLVVIVVVPDLVMAPYFL
jgi:hypothetical protein